MGLASVGDAGDWDDPLNVITSRDTSLWSAVRPSRNSNATFRAASSSPTSSALPAFTSAAAPPPTPPLPAAAEEVGVAVFGAGAVPSAADAASSSSV